MTTEEKTEFLKTYHGRPLRIMEICGSHTSAISRAGLRGILSPQIELISGPGCPVCVTPSSYIDRLIELSFEDNTTVCVFGDMLRVLGSSESLSRAKGRGGSIKMLYSPLELTELAVENPEIKYVFAAVGFETTTPAYALLLKELQENGLKNVRLLTALKTMPRAVAWLCENAGKKGRPDAFLAPGHVCSVAGYEAYEELAEKYGVSFAVSGFEEEELADSLYGLVKMLSEQEKPRVKNFYARAVSRKGNEKAGALVSEFFEACDAVWRGIGLISGSGMKLKNIYADYDAGSGGLTEDRKINTACRCGEVLCGRIKPTECPLFGKACTPLKPQGACMVSEEGACRAYYM